VDLSEREAAVRRNTTRLMVAEPMLRAVLTLTFTVAVVAVVEYSNRDAFAGFMASTNFVLVAVGSFVAGRAMDRVGRRPGLMIGYAVILAGCGLAAAAASARSAGTLIAAIGLIGLGTGAANLGRGAVADMHPPERRARTVGIVLAVGTVGAVGGPLLSAGVQHGARHWLHSDPLLIPWAATATLAVAAFVAVSRLRPDPRDLSVAATENAAPESGRRSVRELLRVPALRTAVLAMGAAQASMVGIMGITPVEIGHHGGGPVAVGATVSLHVAGMFAFSPIIGALLDRVGRRPGLVGGAGASIAGAAITAIGAGSTLVMAIGLFLVGLGWSASYLATTAVVSDVTGPGERAGALGLLDLVAASAAAVGALASGFMLELIGYASVGWTVAVLLIPVSLMASRMREPAFAGAA
jgi:MFS family permease